ncbi:hypothetical protein DD595_25895, partial [Enterobacter cloacae complex sp. 4DZ3-17B2]
MHVSTAYSNCTRSDIEEKFYEPKITGKMERSPEDNLRL